jgi:hypothetical protein
MLYEENTRIEVLLLLKNLGFNEYIRYQIQMFEIDQECEIIDKLLQKSEYTKKYYNDQNVIYKGYITFPTELYLHDKILFLTNIIRSKIIKVFENSNKYKFIPIWKYFGYTNDYTEFFVIKLI